jgi:hypothetical protein
MPITPRKTKRESPYSNGWCGIIGNGCIPRSATNRPRNTRTISSAARLRRPVSATPGDVQSKARRRTIGAAVVVVDSACRRWIRTQSPWFAVPPAIAAPALGTSAAPIRATTIRRTALTSGRLIVISGRRARSTPTPHRRTHQTNSSTGASDSTSIRPQSPSSVKVEAAAENASIAP